MNGHWYDYGLFKFMISINLSSPPKHFIDISNMLFPRENRVSHNGLSMSAHRSIASCASNEHIHN